MRTRMWLAAIGCMVIGATGGLNLKSGVAQEEDIFGTEAPPDEPARPGKQPTTRVKSGERIVSEAGGRQRVIAYAADPKQATRLIEEAAAALVDAEDREAKEAAQKKLSDLLNQYFEDDMKRREEELVKIEERLRNLRALLEKRRAKRQEIIDLQIKVLSNEAIGLGFFSGGSPEGFPQYPMLLQKKLMQKSPWETGGGAGWYVTESPYGPEERYGASRTVISPTPPPSPMKVPPPAGRVIEPSNAPRTRPPRPPQLPTEEPVNATDDSVDALFPEESVPVEEPPK